MRTQQALKPQRLLEWLESVRSNADPAEETPRRHLRVVPDEVPDPAPARRVDPDACVRTVTDPRDIYLA